MRIPIPNSQRGFTLIEMILVIVTMGVIGTAVSVFMRSPVDAYFDSVQRAGLTDTADTAVRRMARDIRKALPNSVRNPSNQCIEFIPTKTGGRYRSTAGSTGGADFLNFAAADISFNMLGLNSALPTEQQIATGDVIAVYNLGIPGSDAYAGSNTSTVTGVVDGANEATISIASRQFPLPSGSSRFHVIPGNERIVSFVCTNGNLFRNANYTYPASMDAATACPTTGGTLMASNVTCSLVYSGTDLQRNGLIQMNLTASDPGTGESVRLYHEVHVDNAP
ncbi:MAG: type II secretion system GspH family protein [Gammaproteobacteria bacterium]|nr:type II secretion system GspH family protein [Gammaproteobacteria bacterium]MBU0786678.1 type II secretion system GspH family protein [Gammaproteobacteria bacterium]MBU0814251.1 type II secretion system GspH family protein [Gammaproteobacteria bacterium]MBU1786229.1 type II secretion system GspH family protein [Gammaproteobacteria bacterium]